MQNFSGRWNTIQIFQNNDTNYLTPFNVQTLEVLANPTLSNSPINGATEILPGSIPGSAIANGAIGSAQLGTLVTLPTLANNTFFLAGANGGGTVNLIEANLNNNIQHGALWEALQLNNNKTLSGTTTGAVQQSWMKTNTSNQWQFLSDAYTNNLIPNANNTYSLGNASTVYGPSYFQNTYIADYSTSNKFYRTGTWTPTLHNGTPSTYTQQTGSYFVIGNICFISFVVTWSGANTSGTPALIIDGLPFPANASAAIAGGNIGFFNNYTLAQPYAYMAISSGSNPSSIQYIYNVSATVTGTILVAGAGTAAGQIYYMI